MDTKYIRIGQLASRPGHEGMLPASAATLWRWARNGTFPAPIKLGPGTTAWRVQDVEAWLKARSAA